MSDIPPWAYRIYRQNLRRNHNRPTKAARIERPYLWLLWTAHGIAWWAERVQQRGKYSANTTREEVE